jgi:riboflavin synthase
MFSGIVETIGVVVQLTLTPNCLYLTLRPQQALLDVRVGDSIAVNGTCLTVTAINNGDLCTTVVPETIRCTNLAALSSGAWVNLERAVLNNGRNSGHYVQGHIDGLGEICELTSEGSATLLTCSLPQQLVPYVVIKGYIAIDGMSLTVAAIANTVKLTKIVLSLIPYTKQHTIAGRYQVGNKVNIEVDILSKYLEKLITRSTVC